MHQLQSLALDFLYHHAKDFLLCLLVFWQEHQSRAIFSLFWNRDALQQDELMRYLDHYAGAITVSPNFSSTMSHVLQYVKRIVNELMTLVAVDVHNHSNPTSIMLITALIESPFLCLKFTFCHIIPTFAFVLLNFGCKVNSFCLKTNKYSIFFILKK